jgi:hypothetical protein
MGVGQQPEITISSAYSMQIFSESEIDGFEILAEQQNCSDLCGVRKFNGLIAELEGLGMGL